MVDAWESLQPGYTRTADVLDHFNEEINGDGGVLLADGALVSTFRSQANTDDSRSQVRGEKSKLCCSPVEI